MDEWKQSAVIFYVACTLITQIAFFGCILYRINNNADRKRKFKKICCCMKDPMVAYDTVESEEKSLMTEIELGEEIDDAI